MDWASKRQPMRHSSRTECVTTTIVIEILGNEWDMLLGKWKRCMHVMLQRARYSVIDVNVHETTNTDSMADLEGAGQHLHASILNI